MLEQHYEYCEIGDRLAKMLHNHLERGDSVVVLGGDGVGKRYVLDLCNELREKDSLPPLPVAAFEFQRVISRESEVVSALAGASGLKKTNVKTLQGWSEAVCERARATGQPVRLAVTNVDSLSKSLAYRLLTHVHTLTDDERSLVVLLTGRGNLIDLIDGGPTSAWACAHQYVVHAHDDRHFGEFLHKRMTHFQLGFPAGPEGEDVVRKLRDYTGRDVTLLRAVLWSLTDKLNYHRRVPASFPVKLHTTDVPEHLSAEHVVAVGAVLPFQQIVRTLEAAACEAAGDPLAQNSPHVLLLKALSELLRNGEVRYHQRKPHILELVGLAKRNDSHTRLHWFSRYTQDFAQQYFTPQRLGDLYALSHNWPAAYEYYADVPPGVEKERPLSEEDHVTLMCIADAVTVHFNSLVGIPYASRGAEHFQKTLDSLRAEFLQALEHLLGFPKSTVSCWHAKAETEGVWERLASHPGGPNPPDSLCDKWSELRKKGADVLEKDLSGTHENGFHWIACRDAQGRVAMVVLLGGDPLPGGDPLFNHPLRQSVINRILRGYRQARERLVINEDLREDVLHRKVEANISRPFVDLAGGGKWDLNTAMDIVAKSLCENVGSIARVIFADKEEGSQHWYRFRPIYDTKSGGLLTNTRRIPAEKSLYDDKTADGRHFSFSAAEVNRMMRKTRLIPFRNQGVVMRYLSTNRVIAVEASRPDGLFPNDLDFLIHIVDRLKTVWQQSSWLSLLLDSQESIKTPSLLLDQQKRIIFANQESVEKLELKSFLRQGWQDKPVVVPANVPHDMAEALDPAADTDVRTFKALTDQMRGTWLRECRPLTERGGWALTFRNRAFLFGFFELMRNVEKSTDQARALDLIAQNVRELLMIDSAKLRIYIIDPDPDTVNGLVSRTSNGFLKTENRKRFSAGKVKFRQAAAPDCWKCLDSKKPEVFKLVAATEPLGDGRTSTGLEYTRILFKAQDEILEKQLGDVWIDLPLLSPGGPLGKLTLAFAEKDVEKLTPDLSIIFGALALLLSDLLERIRQADEREIRIVEEADRAMAGTAHTMLNQLAVMTVLVAQYRRFEEDLPELVPITTKLSDFYHDARRSLDRIKDRAGPVTLRPVPMDLIAAIRVGLAGLEPGICKLGGIPELPGDWDPDHWSGVFAELAENSRVFARPGVPLEVRVAIELTEFRGAPAVRIVYQDNGRGVPQKFKERVFQRESHREEVGRASSGLGMSYAWKLCHAYNGSVQEVGEYGFGAKFVFDIPLPQPSSGQPAAADTAPVRDSLAASL